MHPDQVQRESSASGTARRVAPAETIGASANQRQIFGVLAAKLGANATAWFNTVPAIGSEDGQGTTVP